MLVTKLTAVQRTGLYRVHLDGGERLDVDAGSLIEFKLHAGTVLSPADYAAVRLRSQTIYWTRRCMNKLARRPQSAAELNRFLLGNKVEADVQRAVFAKLEASSLLDDAAFADWYARLSVAKRKSRRVIAYELFRKGIAKPIAEQAIAHHLADDTDQLKALIVKKRGMSRYRDDTKLAQYLVRKGFQYSDISRHLKEVPQQDY